MSNLKNLENIINSYREWYFNLKRYTERNLDLKFKKDKLINKLDLVSREEFEVLKKLVQKQDLIIKKIQKKKN